MERDSVTFQWVPSTLRSGTIRVTQPSSQSHQFGKMRLRISARFDELNKIRLAFLKSFIRQSSAE
jgi:hypothetical protein